jgi:hypothetical protein
VLLPLLLLPPVFDACLLQVLLGRPSQMLLLLLLLLPPPPPLLLLLLLLGVLPLLNQPSPPHGFS